MFTWKEKLSEEKEVAMLCKAKKTNFKKIDEAVKKLHSYEVPCVVALDVVASNSDYADWVEGK